MQSHRNGDRRTHAELVGKARSLWLGENTCAHCGARVPENAATCKVRPLLKERAAAIAFTEPSVEVVESFVPIACKQRMF